MAAAVHANEDAVWAQQIALEALAYHAERTAAGEHCWLEAALIMIEPDLPAEIYDDAFCRLVLMTAVRAVRRLH